MNNKSFSRYKYINSIVHSIDPLTKFICFILIIVTIFIAQSEFSLGIVFVFLFIVSLFAKIKIKTYFSIFLFILPFFILMFFLYLIKMNWNESLYYVIFMSLRLYIFMLLSIIYTSTTKEIEIAQSIEWFIKPLRLLKIPTYEISMIIMLSLRFIPLLIEDLRMIFIAQTSRGVNVINGSLKTKIKGTINSLLPMIVIAFKRSDNIANSMIIRGYKVGQKRTKFIKNKFKILEFLALFITITILCLVCFEVNGVIF